MRVYPAVIGHIMGRISPRQGKFPSHQIRRCSNVPQRMKAVTLPTTGPISNLKIGDIAVPSPQADQVLVKVAACAVCYRDLLDRQGAFPFIKKDIVLGHEVAGTIVRVGDQVNDVKEGQKVVSLHWSPCLTCTPCRTGNSTHCQNRSKSFLGITANGGYAQYMVCGSSGVVPVPEGFSSAEASTIMCTYGTVWHSAIVRGRMKPSEKVLITGATGGVGTAAVQIATKLGCDVVAVTGNEAKAKYLSDMGVQSVIVSPDCKQVHEKVGPVDIAIEAVGAPTFDSSLKSLREGGRLVLIGNVTVSEVKLKLGLPIINELEIIGGDSCTKTELMEVFSFLKNTRIRPKIQTTLPLEKALEAQQMLENRVVSGRVVLQVSQDW